MGLFVPESKIQSLYKPILISMPRKIYPLSIIEDVNEVKPVINDKEKLKEMNENINDNLGIIIEFV